MYQKQLFQDTGPASIDGFGMNHEGTVANFTEFLSSPIFANYSQTQKNDIAAYSMCFDTGMAPAVGYARTVTAANVTSGAVHNDLALLAAQAAAGNIDLIVKGAISGQVHGLLYVPSANNFTSDKTGLGPFTLPQLGSAIVNGGTLTFMGVPAGSGVRMGIDRDLNGILDGDQH
jgi:hypothetical protein